MQFQENAKGKLEAVGSIHYQQLKESGVPVAPHLEQPLPEFTDEPITAQGVPPSTELGNQEPAADGGGSVTTADVNENPAGQEPAPEKLSERNSREELDAEATTRGINPEDYSNKRELLDAIEEHDEANA